jgi:hypothetical protein
VRSPSPALKAPTQVFIDFCRSRGLPQHCRRLTRNGALVATSAMPVLLAFLRSGDHVDLRRASSFERPVPAGQATATLVNDRRLLVAHSSGCPHLRPPLSERRSTRKCLPEVARCGASRRLQITIRRHRADGSPGTRGSVVARFIRTRMYKVVSAARTPRGQRPAWRLPAVGGRPNHPDHGVKQLGNRPATRP